MNMHILRTLDEIVHRYYGDLIGIQNTSRLIIYKSRSLGFTTIETLNRAEFSIPFNMTEYRMMQSMMQEIKQNFSRGNDARNTPKIPKKCP